jgi:hypothetical protein
MEGIIAEAIRDELGLIIRNLIIITDSQKTGRNSGQGHSNSGTLFLQAFCDNHPPMRFKGF